jgi:hypothetical protein
MPTAKRTALVTGASGLAGGYKPEGFEEAERSFRPPKLFQRKQPGASFKEECRCQNDVTNDR